MDLSESQPHSFIIKLWLEEASVEAGQTAWRGQIKHVPGGEQRHIKNFDEITDFIKPYLKSKSAEPGWRARAWRRIRRMRSP